MIDAIIICLIIAFTLPPIRPRMRCVVCRRIVSLPAPPPPLQPGICRRCSEDGIEQEAPASRRPIQQR